MATAPSQSDSAAAHHEAVSCPNCGKELQGKYCYDCGEKKVHGHDLTLRHFLQHALHEFTHLDSKVFATVRYLFTRPGFLSQEYVAGRRLRYMQPLSLFLIASAVFLVVGSFVMLSGFDVHQLSKADKKGHLDAAWEKIATKKHLPKEVIVDRVQETMHKVTTALQLADVLAMAGLLALLFRGRYFVEHLVFSLHYLSFTHLAAVLAAPLYAMVTPLTWQAVTLSAFSTLVFFTYLTIGLRRFYGHNMAPTVLKAVVTYIVTQAVIIFTLIVAFVAAVVHAARS
jgi:hypothetical protein